MSDLELFHLDPVPAPEPEPPLSADQRRTIQRRRLLDRGLHPLTRMKAHPGLGTCGTCKHIDRQGGTAGSYLKCGLGPRSRGPATDIRRSWPACHRHEAAS